MIQAIRIDDTQWTPYQVPANVNFSFLYFGGGVVYVSENATPQDDYIQMSSGEINGFFQAQTTMYFKMQYGSGYVIFATDISTTGGGGGSGGGVTPPAPTYFFQAPLVNNGGNISIALAQSLKVVNSQLDLDLLQDQNFRNALNQISEALRIADYTSVGRVMPVQNHFQLNALTGELSLDLSPTGVLAQNFTEKTDFTALEAKVTANTQNIARHDNEIADLDNQINLLETGKADTVELQALEQKVNTNTQDLTQAKSDITALQGRVTTAEGNITTNSQDIQSLRNDLNTLDSGVVKTGNENQDVDGVKNFLKELNALSLTLRENAVDAGALDINNSQGYISISQTTQGILQLLAGLGFIDGTTTFRIRNLAGGVVTFNTLARYESTLNPTDDKDLVPLATLNQVKAELLALIQGSQGGLTFIGEISNTKAEVEAQPDLLTQFVQQVESRAPRKGDFVRTSDSFGFIFNGTDWRNFGQVSVSLATTTTAGIVMLGSQDGELEDVGGGKAKVIGWDTITQSIQDLETRTTTNTQAIQQINTNLQDVAFKSQANTFTANNTFTNSVVARNLQVNNNIGQTTGATSNLGAFDVTGANRFISFSETISGALSRTAVIGRDASTGGKLRIYNQYPKAGGGVESILVNTAIEMPSNYAPQGDKEVTDKIYVDTLTGSLTLLATTAKDNLVNAINEVKGIADNATTSLSLKADSSTIGNLQDLTTTSKTNLVSAVNEVNGKFSNLVDLTSQQIITGEKDFDNELRANNLVTHDNGVDYGALDIRNNAGYLSITTDNLGTISKSATFGFEDGNNDLVLRNKVGTKILVNQVLRYESAITPTDDKDLVPFLELKNVSNKIGDLTNLTTQDKTSLVLAVNELVASLDTKASADNVVDLTSNQEVNGIKTFNNKTSHNANIALISNNAFINFEGITSYTQGYAIRFQADSLTAGSTVDMLRFHKAGNKWNIRAYLNSSNAFDRVEINGPTRVTNMLDPTANAHGANKLYVDNKSATTLQSANEYADTKASLSGDNTFTGSNTFDSELKISRRLRFTTNDMSIAPATNTKGDIYLSDGSIGANCYADLNLENRSTIKNAPDPVNPQDLANKQYVDTKSSLTGDNTFSGSNAFSRTVNVVNLQATSNIGTATGSATNLGAVDINGSNRFLSFSDTLTSGLTRTAMIGRDTSTGGKLRIYNSYPKATGGNESIIVNTAIEMPSGYTPTENKFVADKEYADSIKTAIKQELKDIVAQSTDFSDFQTRIQSW